ncbi:hypothetical protein ES319_D01G005100v1 [Gossypium barbadense]|uniref:Chaperone DnaJ C-terminal domain-containing protein n=2 Tax=Gossypium TaxID=3633 RepID=A0A5J5SK13_GOSBA|nr:hypothetical protein ES319_D01G005100v1 [Gossypium barbadense]TYG81451.1 hypothetical protein ES288_D01G005800v1 [Gossypium darwinii]
MGDHSHSHRRRRRLDHEDDHDQDRDEDHNHDRHRSNTSGIIGLSCKAYKSIVNKWCSDRNSPKKEEGKIKDHDDSSKKGNKKEQEDKSKKGEKHLKREKQNRLSADESMFSRQFSFLSKSSSRRSHTPTPVPTYLSKSSIRTSNSPLRFSLLRTFSKNGRDKDETPQKQQQKRSVSANRASTLSRSLSRKGNSETEKPNLSRSTSQRSTTPIIFSHSIARRKPLPVEKTLECTLEELCHGGLKKINIVKDVISEERMIVKQEETLTINVKPGWTKGTKVTFEGKGDEKPGYLPADIIFTIQEKRHELFKRTGDDLEIVVEIPLVKALTGCSLSVPLLGGETMSIHVSEVIYPGYEKVIHGQGMPNVKGDKRGDLRITFLVKFPAELSDEQRSETCSILEGCC